MRRNVWGMTEAQTLLQVHLKELGIETVAEFRFDGERRFTFDLANEELRIGFECNGHWQGRHGEAWSKGFETLNLAQALGWTVFVFHNRYVMKRKAKKFLAKYFSRGF